MIWWGTSAGTTISRPVTVSAPIVTVTLFVAAMT